MGFLNDFVQYTSVPGLVYTAGKAIDDATKSNPTPTPPPGTQSISLKDYPAYVSAHPDLFPGVDPNNIQKQIDSLPWMVTAGDASVSVPIPPPPPPAPAPAATPVAPTTPQPTAADAAQQDFLQQQLDKIYGQVQTQGENAIDQQFIPSRQKAISEEAALGRLTSPVSIVPLSRLDQSKQLALGNLYGNIAGQKASGQVDVAKTIDTIMNARQDASQQNNQFLQDLNLRRDTLNQQSNQFSQQLNLDKLLGLNKTQTEKDIADQAKPKDFLDYLLQASAAYKNLKPGV